MNPLRGKYLTLAVTHLQLPANQPQTYAGPLFCTCAFSEFIYQFAYNRQLLAGEDNWLEARTSEFSAPVGRVKKGFKNKTEAWKARKALGKDRPTPKPGFGHNGLIKGPACTIGRVNKCGAGGAPSLVAAKNAKQRPAGLSLAAKKEKKTADRKGNRQVAVKIKHQNFVKQQNVGQPNQKLQQWKIDPKTHVAQRAKTDRNIKKSWNKNKKIRKAHYKTFEKTGPSLAAKNERLAESALLKGKDPKREQYKTAKAAYDASINSGTFPGRKAVFNTPQDGELFVPFNGSNLKRYNLQEFTRARMFGKLCSTRIYMTSLVKRLVIPSTARSKSPISSNTPRCFTTLMMDGSGVRLFRFLG